MNSPSLPEQAAGCSPADCSATELSGTSSGTPTAAASSRRGSRKGSSTKLQSSAMSEHSSVTDAASYQGLVDVVSGGFPCQRHSVAGKRRGAADKRDMWPAFKDVVAAVRPRYVFAENVPGLLGSSAGDPDGDGSHQTPSEPVRYFGTVLRDLASLGYGVRWTVLELTMSVTRTGGSRLWILAYSASGNKWTTGAEFQASSNWMIEWPTPVQYDATPGGLETTTSG